MPAERVNLSISPQGPGWQAAVAAARVSQTYNNHEWIRLNTKLIFYAPINPGQMRSSHNVGAMLVILVEFDVFPLSR